MANENSVTIGKVIPTFKGDWNANTSYSALDVVVHKNITYVAETDILTGTEPKEGTGEWAIMARGAVGPQGEQGIQGIQGPIGPIGPTGPVGPKGDMDLSQITVGGRNYILNSQSLNIVARENVSKVEKLPYDANTNMWHITAPAGGSVNAGFFYVQSSNMSKAVESGQRWTFSFDIKGTGVYSDKHIGIESSNPINGPTGNVSSSWTRVSATGISTGSNNILVYFNASVTALDVYIKLPKLEIGNVPTDWTPAPEDVSPKLDIGGRNLLLSTSRSFTGVGDNSTNGNFDAQGGRYYLAGGKKVSDLYKQYGPSQYLTLSFDWVASGDSISGQFNPQWDGQPYGGLTNSGVIKPSIANTSGHYKSTVQLNYSGYSTGIATAVKFRQDNLQGTITISNLKLEAGNTATDWTPAPEDVNPNLVVGGRNYLTNSSGESLNGWTNNGTVWSVGVDATRGSVFISTPPTPWTDGSTNSLYRAVFSSLLGRPATVSFWAKASVENSKFHSESSSSSGVINPNLSTSWARYSYYVPNFTGTVYFMGVDAGTTYYLDDIKLEAGNVPTDWSPAPEDTISATTRGQILDGYDLNGYTDSYKYVINGAKNLVNYPSGASNWAALEVENINGNTATQTLKDSNSQVFIRSMGGNPAKWSAWRNVSDPGDPWKVVATAHFEAPKINNTSANSIVYYKFGSMVLADFHRENVTFSADIDTSLSNDITIVVDSGTIPPKDVNEWMAVPIAGNKVGVGVDAQATKTTSIRVRAIDGPMTAGTYVKMGTIMYHTNS